MRNNYPKVWILIAFKIIIIFIGVNSQNVDLRDPNSDVVKFYFYPDSGNSSNRIELKSSQKAVLRKNQEAKIIVHGVTGKCDEGTPLVIIEGYQKAQEKGKGNYNLFCIDFAPLAKPFNTRVPSGYEDATRYVGNLVGTEVEKLIQELQKQGFISSLRQIHIIGHSLGAHVAGAIGRKVQESRNYKEKLGRITGLDPGNTIAFEELDLDNQLDQSDAEFVDVYHTSAGTLGLRGKFGQVDFYPDGGTRQRSCRNQTELSDRIRELGIGTCSHVIVAKYWAISILNRSLGACQADSWDNYKTLRDNGICNKPINFGDAAPTSAHGKYYIDMPPST